MDKEKSESKNYHLLNKSISQYESNYILPICFITCYFKSKLLQQTYFLLLAFNCYRTRNYTAIHANWNLVIINIKVKLFLSRFSNTKSPDYRLVRNENQILYDIVGRQVSWYSFNEITSIKFHLILYAELLNVFVNMFISPFRNRIINLVLALNSTYSIVCLLCPYLDTDDFQVIHFTY